MSFRYCFELHLHTSASIDSLATLERIAIWARRRALAGFAVTDHNKTVNQAELERIKQKYELPIIPGVEIKTPQGDLIGLFLNELPPRHGLNEAAQFILDHGGVTYLPHPGRGCKLDEINFALIDVVEVFNARCSTEENKFAVEYFHDLKPVKACGSDAHLLRDIGNATVCFETNVLEQIKQDLKTGRFQIGEMKYNQRISIYSSQIINLYKRHRPLQATRILLEKALHRIAIRKPDKWK